MTYQIKNTISGKMVRDAISGKPLSFDTAEEARVTMRSHAATIRVDCKKPFRFVVVRTQSD